MGKIVITTNVSLDGVVQDPDGTEGFGRGGCSQGRHLAFLRFRLRDQPFQNAA